MIPVGITHAHLAKAVAEIERNGIPPRRQARHCYYIHEGKTYPPKYVISLAGKYAFGQEIPAKTFITTDAMTYLRNMGCKVINKESDNEAI